MIVAGRMSVDLVLSLTFKLLQNMVDFKKQTTKLDQNTQNQCNPSKEVNTALNLTVHAS